MSVPRIPVPATKMQIAPTLVALTDVIADKDLLEMEKPVKVCNAVRDSLHCKSWYCPVGTFHLTTMVINIF